MTATVTVYNPVTEKVESLCEKWSREIEREDHITKNAFDAGSMTRLRACYDELKAILAP